MSKLISEQAMKNFEAQLEAYIRKGLETYRELGLSERNRAIKRGVEELVVYALNGSRGNVEKPGEQDQKQMGAEFQSRIDEYFSQRLPVDGAPDQLTFSRPSSGEIWRGLNDLLAGERAGLSGGFVVFGGEQDLDFVQYVLREHGFLLNWPTVQPGGLERLPAVRAVLEAVGFKMFYFSASAANAEKLAEQAPTMIVQIPKGFMFRSGNDFCAQTGRDVHFVYELTKILLRDVFGFEPT